MRDAIDNAGAEQLGCHPAGQPAGAPGSPERALHSVPDICGFEASDSTVDYRRGGKSLGGNLIFIRCVV